MGKISITENEFRFIVESCVNKILNEDKVLLDNFDKISKYIEFNSPDDFYLVQIIKRRKDNKHIDTHSMSRLEKNKQNYYMGSWYLKSYRIKSADELLSLKGEIVDICHKENARAYITMNSRSEKQTNDFMPIYIKGLLDKKVPLSDPRIIHASEIVSAQAKNGPSWRNTRKRFFMDVDTKDKKVWKDILDTFEKNGIRPIESYNSPSGGMHIIFPDKNDAGVGPALKELTIKYNHGYRFGPHSIMLPEFDKKLILYSNVDTPGY